MFSNYPLMAAFAAIVFAQIIKIPVAYLLNRKTSLALATSTGGMPSSHSASVSALITALAIEYGIDSPLVAIASTFGVIVMFDSMGVRRQSGEQGILLNELVAEFTRLHEKVMNLSRDGFSQKIAKVKKERHLKEYLGHKPIEVFFGILTGIAIAYVTHWILIR